MANQNSTPVTTDVTAAATILRQGGLVAFPTETVYGLGADATNPTAVSGIFEAKQRPTFDPLIVHVADRAAADPLVTTFPPAAAALADRFWPGPLTLVLPKRPLIPDLVTSGLTGVGVRVPGHPMARALLARAGCPVAAPSANRFARISPTTAAHVTEELDGRIDLILDGGPCGLGVESTVLSFLSDPPELLRPGGCPLEDIEAVIGPVTRISPASRDPAASDDSAARPAPGMLDRHYAPRTPLRVIPHDDVATPLRHRRCGLLTEGTRSAEPGFALVESLSDTGDLRAAAAGFFEALRRLDSAGLDLIVAHRFPETGLGRALNDRLSRAAH